MKTKFNLFRRACVFYIEDTASLRDILRQVGVTHLPQSHRMNEREMAHDQRRKCRLGLAGSIIPHQGHVIIHHLVQL